MGIEHVETSEEKHEKSRRHNHKKKHKRHNRHNSSSSTGEDFPALGDLSGQAAGQMIVDSVAAHDKKQGKSRRHSHKQKHKRHHIHNVRDSDVEDGASVKKRKRKSRSSDVEEKRHAEDDFERTHIQIRRHRSRDEENNERDQMNRRRHYSPQGEYWRTRDRRNFEKTENFSDELESYKMSRKHARNVRESHPNKSEAGNKNGDKATNKENKNSGADSFDKESANGVPSQDPKENVESEPPKNKKNEDILTMRTGGAYIPPARLRAMQAQITDKSSAAYQRIAWEALKKSINGLVNKVNVSNIIDIVRELFQENIVRGRGLLSRSVIQAQAGSPTFTHVYAAVVAIINTKFPQIGELILRRLIILFRKAFKRNDKTTCLSSCKFIAHLVNQQVAHEVLSLEILTLLLENPTDDSVEVAVGFIKEVGAKLTEVSPRGVRAIYDRMRSVLHEGKVDARVQYMIEIAVQVRKDSFKDFPSVLEELQKVKEDDQFTHMLTLEEAGSTEDNLNVFKHDPDYEANEEKYKAIRKELLEESSSEEEGSDNNGSDDDEDSDDSVEGEQEKTTVIDNTETNLIALRRNIYLTIQSSLDFEECAHKLLKLQLKPGQETELCHMILDCCAQQRTYEKFYGLLAQRFCTLNKIYIQPFQDIFAQSYETIHRLETNKLRNVAKFYGHLLYTDAISWEVVQHIKMNEDDTTSSSRIFVKILFQELAEYMGIIKLNERLKDPMLQVFFEGLLPRDNPRNTRFSINFFTSIGLGGLTDELREHLKNAPKPVPVQEEESSGSSSSSTDGDSDSSEDSASDSSNSSEDSEGGSSDSSEPSTSEDNGKSKHSKKKYSRRR